MHFFKRYWPWIASVWIAFVFIQSLFFKFAGAPETEHIFGTLGDTFGLPWFASIGGYLIGGFELIASIMLFTRIWPWGALLAFEIMSGAIVFHLFTPLGIVMPTFDKQGAIIGDDGGTLFMMACLTWVCAMALVIKDITAESSQLRAVLPRR